MIQKGQIADFSKKMKKYFKIDLRGINIFLSLQPQMNMVR